MVRVERPFTVSETGTPGRGRVPSRVTFVFETLPLTSETESKTPQSSLFRYFTLRPPYLQVGYPVDVGSPGQGVNVFTEHVRGGRVETSE